MGLESLVDIDMVWLNLSCPIVGLESLVDIDMVWLLFVQDLYCSFFDFCSSYALCRHFYQKVVVELEAHVIGLIHLLSFAERRTTLSLASAITNYSISQFPLLWLL